jgi:hypothetical protein
MATSTVPALIDALVVEFTSTLTGLRVSDGMGATDDPGDYLMVGVEDPDVDGFSSSADVTQEWANSNYTGRDESGDIKCAALSWNGDGDITAARTAVYASLGQVETVLRQNPSLSLPDVLWTGFGGSLQLNQIQDGAGAVAMVLFSIHFRARI